MIIARNSLNSLSSQLHFQISVKAAMADLSRCVAKNDVSEIYKLISALNALSSIEDPHTENLAFVSVSLKG